MFTDVLDFSSYDEATVSFSFYPDDMENGEDFFFEVSTNGGSSYSVIQEWNAGSEFQNNIRYFENIIIDGISFTSNTVFRFRCDASSNTDRIFIDDVEIYGCVNSSSSRIVNNMGVEMISNVTQTVGKDIEFTLYPNPTKEVLNIQFNGQVQDVAIIYITDITTGRVVHELKQPIEQRVTLNFDGLSAGLYQVSAVSNLSQQVSTKRFVIIN